MSQQPPGYIASYWTQNVNQNQGADGVVCHTSDPTKYHYPDGRQGDRMNPGAWGMMGAVIPRARGDGSSRGFDSHRAGPILVDPNSPLHDGVVLTPEQLSNDAIQQALAAVGNHVGYGRETDAETWAVLQMLSKPIKNANDEEMLPEYLVASTPSTQGQSNAAFDARNPLLPNSYVVPASNIDGTQQPKPVTTGQPQSWQQIQAGFVKPKPVAATAAQPQRSAIKHAAAQPAPAKSKTRRVEYLQSPEATSGPMLDEAVPEPEVVEEAPPPMPRAVASIEPEPEQVEEQEMAVQPTPIALDTNAVNQLLQLLAGAAAMNTQQQQPAPAPAPAPARRAGPVAAGRSAVSSDHRVPNPSQHRPRPVLPMRQTPPPPPTQGEADDIVTDWTEVDEQAAAINENTILSLQVPFLTGPEGNKPGVQAIVQLPGFGNSSVRFHSIIEGAGCIILVYDTRYEGNQWAPPVTGETPFTLTVAKTKKTYSVCSLGLQFNMGCLDFIVLVVEDAAAAKEEAE